MKLFNNIQTLRRVMNSMIDKLAEAEELLEKYDWISVKDRLPKPRTSVLVCCNTYFSDGQVKVVKFLDKHSGFLTSCTVTHWMPLPQKPESEDIE